MVRGVHFRCSGCKRILTLHSQKARAFEASFKYFVPYRVEKNVLVDSNIIPDCAMEQIRGVHDS